MCRAPQTLPRCQFLARCLCSLCSTHAGMPSAADFGILHLLHQASGVAPLAPVDSDSLPTLHVPCPAGAESRDDEVGVASSPGRLGSGVLQCTACLRGHSGPVTAMTVAGGRLLTVGNRIVWVVGVFTLAMLIPTSSLLAMPPCRGAPIATSACGMSLLARNSLLWQRIKTASGAL